MRRAVVVLAAFAVAASFAVEAGAEMPQNQGRPEIGGRVAVGEVLLGHNGTWLYADGSGCGPECSFSFRWERCSGVRCVTVSANRGYRPKLADLGRELRLAVQATKFDCGEWNYAAGTQECAFVSRSAYASPVYVTTRARVAASSLAWPARLKIERASLRGQTLRLTVADTLGRLVVGAKVSSSARGGLVRGRTRADGTAVLRSLGPGPRVVVVRTGTKVARLRLRG
jgi:hypothetical protein